MMDKNNIYILKYNGEIILSSKYKDYLYTKYESDIRNILQYIKDIIDSNCYKSEYNDLFSLSFSKTFNNAGIDLRLVQLLSILFKSCKTYVSFEAVVFQNIYTTLTSMRNFGITSNDIDFAQLECWVRDSFNMKIDIVQFGDYLE